MWADDSKCNLKVTDGNLKVRRPIDKRLDPKYTRGMVKSGCRKGAMVWGCFSGFSGVGPFHPINGIMDQFVYCDILEEKMVSQADSNIPLLRTFLQDNEPMYKSKLVKEWFETNQIEVMK